MPPQPGAIQVTDRLERRIRKPIDLLRCITSGIEIIVLAVAGVAASATTTGVETDITGASGRLPYALLVVAPTVALFAILIIPVALAVRQLVRRQVQRLAEAVATGVLAGSWRPWPTSRCGAGSPRGSTTRSSCPARAPATSRRWTRTWPAWWRTRRSSACPGGRAGGTPCGWPSASTRSCTWRRLDTTLLSFLITLLVGRTIGLGVRYVAGSPSLRPSAAEIATALNSADRQLTEMSRLRPAPRTPNRAGSRHYAATTSTGDRLDVTVYDKDQQAAGAVYRLYRSLLLRGQVSRGAPLSADRTVERRALLSYAAEDAGAPTPAAARGGPGRTGSHRARLSITTQGRRWPSGIPGAPTPSCGTSGTPCTCCTSTGSRTGR